MSIIYRRVCSACSSVCCFFELVSSSFDALNIVIACWLIRMTKKKVSPREEPEKDNALCMCVCSEKSGFVGEFSTQRQIINDRDEEMLVVIIIIMRMSC